MICHHNIPKVIFLIGVAVLAGTVSVNTAYAASVEYTAFPSPYQQLREGVVIDAIQCNASRDLYLRNSEIPVCVSASVHDVLVERGIDLVLYESYSRTVYMLDEPEIQKVQRTVEETILMYDSYKDDAFSNINRISANTITHYPFVLDPVTKTIVAHGQDVSRVDTPSLILGNYADVPSDVILDELQKDNSGVWVDYVFLDPVTNEESLKRSWIVQHDGYIFGSGYYYSIEDKINRVIDDAIALYETGGFDAITAQHEKSRAHYPFVIDPATSIMMAHAGYPALVGNAAGTSSGQSNTVTLANAGLDAVVESKNIGSTASYNEIAVVLETKNVSRYMMFVNPSTGEIDQKHNLYRLYDGYIFGAGYYYPISDKVMNVVEHTIESYKLDKAAAFADVVAQIETFNPHYPFVIDASNKTVVANGAFLDAIGNTSIIFTADNVNKLPEEIITELQNGGTWVEYVYRIPGTDFEETKRSYLQLYDGYIFGSGHYLTAFNVITP